MTKKKPLGTVQQKLKPFQFHGLEIFPFEEDRE